MNPINVNPQGLDFSNPNDVSGSYWNLVFYINTNDDIAGVILPEGQKTSVTYDGAIKALETGAKIEVKIDPQQPYLIHTIQENPIMIAPGATGQSTVQPVYLTYYSWVGGWELYTPYMVSVYKDGSIIGQKLLNERGVSQVQTISTNEGTVRIENLGTLGNNYLSPNIPSQIAIFKGAPNVYDWTQIYNKIDGTTTGSNTKYADYWYGITRNSANQAINPTMTMPGLILSTTYKPSVYGGWSGSDYSGSATPVRPVIYTGDKSSLPSEERGFYCLTEWIESKGISNLASSIFNTQASGSTDALWQSASFVKDTNGANALRLDIPWSAFGTPLVNIRIPTELADTFVEQPIITSTDVSAKWVATGGDYADLQGSLRIAVTLTNKGTVTGGTLLQAQTGNSKLSITPLSMTVNNLVPNVPQTVYFDCTNLGVENQVDDIPVTIIAKDTYTGTETGRDTIYGTLLPTLTTGQTTVNIRAVEKGTNNLIAGLQMQLLYPPSGTGGVKTVYTGTNGETGAITLATPQGGAYTGTLAVQSVETGTYNPTYLSYPINSASSYSVTLEVERKDTVYEQPEGLAWWVYLVIVIAAVVIVLIIVAAVMSKRHPKSKSRRH